MTRVIAEGGDLAGVEHTSVSVSCQHNSPAHGCELAHAELFTSLWTCNASSP